MPSGAVEPAFGRFRPRAAFPLTGRNLAGVTRAFSLGNPESGLRAGFDQGHAGVGETEMVTDLVDQHVADNAVRRLPVLVGVTKDGDTVEKDPVPRHDTARVDHTDRGCAGT